MDSSLELGQITGSIIGYIPDVNTTLPAEPRPHPTPPIQFLLIFNIVLGGEGECSAFLKGNAFLKGKQRFLSNFSSKTQIIRY